MNDLIREKSEKYRDAFAEVAKSGTKEYSCDIDCANLRDFKEEDIDWAKDLGLKLRFHVFEFEFKEETKGLVRIIEKDLAKRLEPIIGRH